MKYKLKNSKGDNHYVVPKIVLVKFGRTLGPYGLAVYNVLVFLVSLTSKGYSFSQDHIANYIGVSRRTVQHYLRYLDHLKLIKIKREKKGANSYTLLRCESPARHQSYNKPYSSKYIYNNINNTVSGNSKVSGNRDSIDGLECRKFTGRKCAANKKRPLSSRKTVKFPKEWYTRVVDAYQELKGIKLKGREFDYIRQDIKTMFMSERRPEEIINCMRWLAGCKETWAQLWTIRTVKMKIPEFLSGKLKTKEEIEREKNYLAEVGGKRYYSDEELELDRKNGKIYWDTSEEKWLPVVNQDDPSEIEN